MKMSAIEKIFVNSPGHSQQVSHHAEKLLKLIDFKAGQKYLDVGCGNGTAPTYLAQKYHLDVTGIDVDPDQIQAAQKQSIGIKNTRFMTVDGTQLPFEASKFDIVVTNKVMHHIPNWQDALSEIVRILKPSGYLIYADFVFPGWLATLGKRIIKNHFGFPTAAALEALMDKQQLSKIHLSKSIVHYEAVLQKI